MLARWPEHIAPGSSSDHVWGFHDFLATALELAGSEAAPDSDGISVVPTLLARGEQAEHEYMYWELPRYDAGSGTFRDEIPSQALRMGKWKGVRPAPDGELELYDLQTDPGETMDLAADEPDILARIQALLEQARQPPRPQQEPDHFWWDSKG